MTRMIVQSKVGADGVLHLEVPLGAPNANSNVQVTIETESAPFVDQTHKELMDAMQRDIGTWQGPFERPEQLPFEKRDEL